MNMQRYYQRLSAHDEWANREVLLLFKQAADPPPRAVRWLGHILAAEFLWLNRIQNAKQTLAVWPEISLADCEKYLDELSVKWRVFGQDLTEAKLAQEVAYKNTKGEEWRNTVGDILTHVFMHSAYHRGQIATAMREAGGTPAYTDFIHAVRASYVAP